jgi:protein-L-isoaspartate(D-aspartate) O-methyltransferase
MLRLAPAIAQERPAEVDAYAPDREQMVAEQIESRGISDPRVLAALRRVPRHEFVLPEARHLAYTDQPLPIGAGQTISQPYIVALMTELADIEPGDRILEIGTGSGYQAAVLAELTDAVYSIEILDELAHTAERTLARLGYAVQVRLGDGFFGWPEAGPFDAILVTAAAPRVPERLIEQLADGGRIVIPLGTSLQELFVFSKAGGAVTQERVIPVRFVPMTGAITSGEGP